VSADEATRRKLERGAEARAPAAPGDINPSQFLTVLAAYKTWSNKRRKRHSPYERERVVNGKNVL